MDLLPFIQSRFQHSYKKDEKEIIRVYLEMALPTFKNDLRIPFHIRRELNSLVSRLKYSYHRTDDDYSISFLDSKENDLIIFRLAQLLPTIFDNDRRNNEEECPVCMEYYSKGNTFHSPVCKHLLCSDCKDKCSKCPLCRRDYKSIPPEDGVLHMNFSDVNS